jgi:hypothetical protein
MFGGLEFKVDPEDFGKVLRVREQPRGEFMGFMCPDFARIERRQPAQLSHIGSPRPLDELATQFGQA